MSVRYERSLSKPKRDGQLDVFTQVVISKAVGNGGVLDNMLLHPLYRQVPLQNKPIMLMLYLIDKPYYGVWVNG